MKKIKGLNFQPWIGANYYNNPKGKILILGESHYLDGEEWGDDLTTVMVQGVINEIQINSSFFERIGNIFDSKSCRSIWNDIAFANLIQNGLSKANSQPSQEDIETINPAFEKLLKELKPDKVIIFSKRVFNYWLTEENAIHIAPISVNGKHSNVWRYTRNGYNSYVTAVNHASRMFGNSCFEWSPLVTEFIKTNYE